MLPGDSFGNPFLDDQTLGLGRCHQLAAADGLAVFPGGANWQAVGACNRTSVSGFWWACRWGVADLAYSANRADIAHSADFANRARGSSDPYSSSSARWRGAASVIEVTYLDISQKCC